MLSPPHLLHPLQLLLLFFVAATEVFYLFPYYWALRVADTSVVTSLFTLGDMLIPLLAFIFLGEVLTIHQYIGFFCIVIAALALTFDPKKLRPNRALVLMFIVGILLAVRAILLKAVYDQGASWGSVMVTLSLFQFALGLPFAFVNGLPALVDGFRKIKSVGLLFAANELFSWVMRMRFPVLPVPIAQGISATQPAFVMATAFFLKKRHPEFLKETISPRIAYKRLLLFLLTIVGIVLVVL